MLVPHSTVPPDQIVRAVARTSKMCLALPPLHGFTPVYVDGSVIPRLCRWGAASTRISRIPSRLGIESGAMRPVDRGDLSDAEWRLNRASKPSEGAASCNPADWTIRAQRRVLDSRLRQHQFLAEGHQGTRLHSAPDTASGRRIPFTGSAERSGRERRSRTRKCGQAFTT